MIHEKEWQGLPCHLTLHNNVVKLRFYTKQGNR